MGDLWASDLPANLDRWELDYVLYDGWDTRSRSSGGFDAVYGIGVHHTASSTSPANDAAWCWRNSDDRPIGNVILMRDGVVWVGAAGASNTQGKGGPYTFHRGTAGQDNGNRVMFSIEAANNGLGEPWPLVQQSAYLTLCCAVLDWATECTPGGPIVPDDVIAHFEWAPGRKYDPAGQSDWAAGSALWNMDVFRGEVADTWEDDDAMPDDETIKRLVREVLDEGTTFGALSWAETNQNIAVGVQNSWNAINEANVKLDQIIAQLEP